MLHLEKYLLSGVLRDGDAGGAAGVDPGAGGGKPGGVDPGAGADKGGGKAYEGPWEGNPAYGFDAEKDKDILGHVASKKYPDLRTALRSGMEAENLARSRNVIEAPDPKALDKWKGWEALGWTPDAAKYTLGGPPKDLELPNGFTMDEGRRANIVKVAHAKKVPLPIVQELVDADLRYQVQRDSELLSKGEKSLADLDAALDKEWGADKEANRTLATRAMRTLGLGMDDSRELEMVLGAEGKPGAPRLLKMFHKIGKAMAEHGVKLDDADQGSPATPSALTAELNRLEQSEEFRTISNNTRDPRYADIMARRQNLIDKLAAAGGGR